MSYAMVIISHLAALAVCTAAPSLARESEAAIAFSEYRIGMPPADFDTSLFTGWDQTFLADGRIGLWTQEDNVTRFDQFEITALPWSESP
jgi:hypothetical protein